MDVVRAENAGACYGVRRALDLALKAAREHGIAHTLGPLIHNPGVVADLNEQGVKDVESLEGINEGALVIRSHGVTPAARAEMEAIGLPVVDATCPHVARAQKAAAELARDGVRVIVVGEPGHPEVEGLKEYAKLEGIKVDVVNDPSMVPDDMHAPIGVVVQTTQRRENLERIVEAIREKGIEPIVKDTICSATRLRQDAASDLAGRVDAMVVVGGKNSSNTTRLAEICAEKCAKTYHVERAGEIDSAWFAGCSTVGVTAGASTPEYQIVAVEELLETL